MLESYPKVHQASVNITKPSCPTNIFEEVCLASDLPIFLFGCNFIIDKSIRKILISNLERQMKKGNLFVSKKIVAKHIDKHIVPFKETDNGLLLEPKFFPFFYTESISKWVTFLVSYLAYIWSQMRHMCYDRFDF